MSAVISAPFRPAALRRTRSRNRAAAAGIDWVPLLLISSHIPLALLLRTVPYASTVHGFVVAVIGVFCALQGRKHPERVAFVSAYIVGAEVLWRMTGSSLPWEFGKYAITAVFAIHLIMNRRRPVSARPLLYFALLLPSTVLTIAASDFTHLHKALSFYMAGPLALAASWAFFSQVRLLPEQLDCMFLSLIAPAVGVATLALFSTVTTADVAFTDEANLVTSGGFGPNQVSGALALGAVCALLWLLVRRGDWLNKTLLFGVLMLLTAQAALTFSRGGIYNAAGAAAVAIFFLLRDRRARFRVATTAVLFVLVGGLVIVPRLQQFTSGAIGTRFADVNTANRDEIMKSDLILWQTHPVLGVGPGMAAFHRRIPHTEITRLLGEHGVFGLAALMVLLVSGLQAIKQARGAGGKAVVGAMFTFSLLFMIDKAMRLAVPSFAFGVAFATLVPERDTQPQVSSRLRRSGRGRMLRRRRSAKRRMAPYRQLPAAQNS